MNTNLLSLIPVVSPLAARFGWPVVGATMLLVLVLTLMLAKRLFKSSGTTGSGRSLFSRFGSSGSTGGSGGGGKFKLVLVVMIILVGLFLALPSLKAMVWGRTKTIDIIRTPPTPDGPKDVFETQPEAVVFLWENERGETKEIEMSADSTVTIPEKSALLFKISQPKTTGMGETTAAQSPFRLVAWKTSAGGYEEIKQGKNLPYPNPGREMMLIDYYHFSVGMGEDGTPKPEKLQITVPAGPTKPGEETQTTKVDAFVELVVDIDLDTTRLPSYTGTPDQLLRDQRSLYDQIAKARADYIASMADHNFELDTQTGLGGKRSCVNQADEKVRGGNEKLLSAGKPFKLAIKTCTVSK